MDWFSFNVAVKGDGSVKVKVWEVSQLFWSLYVIVWTPADKLEKMLFEEKITPSIEYWIFPVPPEARAVISPSLKPLQEIFTPL